LLSRVLHALLDADTGYVIAVIFLATLIRSTLGFGEALVAVPLLAFRIPVVIAAPLAVMVSVIVALAIVLQDWRRIELRAAGGLVLASLFGIPVGVLLLASVDDRLVKMILGALIIAFSIYVLALRGTLRLRTDHAGWMIGCGVISGILGGAYGMNGPPLVVYGTLRRWSPQHFRATLQGYFLPASLAGLIGYGSIGLWNGTIWRYFLLALPAVAIATLLGRALNHRMSGDRFFRIVYAGLVVIGAALLLQAMIE
jgi:uncharacterized membrane protein YfcA